MNPSGKYLENLEYVKGLVTRALKYFNEDTVRLSVDRKNVIKLGLCGNHGRCHECGKRVEAEKGLSVVILDREIGGRVTYYFHRHHFS